MVTEGGVAGLAEVTPPSMDRSLLKEREAFKKRALAATDVKVARAKVTAGTRTKPPKKPKSKLLAARRRYHQPTGVTRYTQSYQQY